MKTKMKTNKSAAKRYSLTGTGKVKYKKAGLRHNTGKRSNARNMKRRSTAYVYEGEVRSIQRILPYGSLI